MAPSITQSPARASAIASRMVNSLTTSFSLMRSPNHRKLRCGNIVPPSISTDFIGGSPCCGHDSKRSWLTRLTAITDILGWGQCILAKFVQFCEGDKLILIIPANHKNEMKYATLQRKEFCDRLIDTVGKLIYDNAPYRSSIPAHCRHAKEHILSTHGINRNFKEYIEIRCSIQQYPNQDNYLRNLIPEKKVKRQLQQRGGICLNLLDYLMMVGTSVVDLHWSEVPFIQVWTAFYCGNHRPPIIISHDHGSSDYTCHVKYPKDFGA